MYQKEMEHSHNISENTFGNNVTLSQGNLSITVNAASTDDNRKFLQNISKTDPVYDKKRIQTLKGPYVHESFRWLLDHGSFNRWRGEDSGIFWIKGDPGKGKTMLICGIVDEFKKYPAMRSNLSYFFCQAADSRVNTAISVIGGLILPMLQRHEELSSQIQATYQDKLDGPNTWFVLCEIFETVIQNPHYKESVFIVDALDECIKDCSALLQFIIQTSDRVKWLISSRNEKRIERELQSIQPSQVLSLESNAECISNSIEIYINSRIHEISALGDDEELRIKTLRILKHKAMGTFLWVALVVEELRNTDHWAVEDVLEEIPAGLECLYGLILNQANGRLKKKGQDACKIALSIITTAERPLHLKELYTFMSFQWEHFKPAFTLQDIQSIAKDCGSILSIRDDIVYFVHQSAKDFIIKVEFPSGLQYQHLKIFQASIDAMSRDLKTDLYNLKTPGIHINDIRPPVSDPLAPLKYCCVFWGQHLLLGCSSAAKDDQYWETNAILYTFLKEKFLCWVESLALIGRLPQALMTLDMVKGLIKNNREGGNETKELREFVQDAYQFLLRSKESLENWPLQLYFSAMIFGEANNAIRQSFEQTVRAHWGPSPTFVGVSHSQSSILLQSLTIGYPKQKNAHFRNYSSRDHIFLELSFSPDASLICSLCSDILVVTRVDTGDLEAEIYVGEGAQFSFTSDSNRIIIVSLTGNVKIWRMEDKSFVEEYALNFREAGIYTRIIGLSLYGDFMAFFQEKWSGSNTKFHSMNKVTIWRNKSTICDCLWDWSGLPQAAFSPNSQLLALADQNAIRIHCSTTGSLVKHLESRWSSNLVPWEKSRLKRYPIFSPDSKYFITMESEEHICIWNTDIWEPLHCIQETERYAKIFHIAISPDSVFLGVCGTDGLKLWSIETGECIFKIAGLSYSMEFSPDWMKSLLVASQSSPAVIQIRHVVNHNKRGEENTNCTFINVVISPDSRFVAARHAQKHEIHIWNGQSGQLVHVLNGDFGDGEGYIQTFSPDSTLLAYGNDHLFVFSVSTGERIYKYPCTSDNRLGPIRSVAFSLDSKCLVVGGDQYVWRPAMHQWKDDIYRSSLYCGLLSVAISPDLSHVATLCRLGSYWNISLTVWHNKRRYTLEGDCDSGYCEAKIAFSSDSAILVFISKNQVKLFNVATKARMQKFRLYGRGNLTTFNQIKDVISSGYSKIRKIKWNDWKEFYHIGFGLYHNEIQDKHNRTKTAWIIVHSLSHNRSIVRGKMAYLPADFRPHLTPYRGPHLDISDTLFAFINNAGAIVLIKLPRCSELNASSVHERSLNMIANVSMTSDSDSRDTKRRKIMST